MLLLLLMEEETELSFSVRARASFSSTRRSRVLPVWLAVERIFLVRVSSPSGVLYLGVMEVLTGRPIVWWWW